MGVDEIYIIDPIVMYINLAKTILRDIWHFYKNHVVKINHA